MGGGGGGGVWEGLRNITPPFSILSISKIKILFHWTQKLFPDNKDAKLNEKKLNTRKAHVDSRLLWQHGEPWRQNFHEMTARS